jgi:SAM-dependent methyltransferase
MPDELTGRWAMLKGWQQLVAAGTAADPMLVEMAGGASPARVARWRRRWPVEVVSAAASLARARERARGKLDHADSLIADPVGIEQASSSRVAAHKAQRIALHAPDALVLDLGCGIAGDALALQRVATRLLAVDRDPLRAWMAAVNLARAAGGARHAVVCAALESLKIPTDAIVHLDPDRRDAHGVRHWRYDQLEPPPSIFEPLLAQARGGILKLGPGVELDALPPGELELISDQGRLVQAVLYTGCLAQASPGERRATRLPEGLSLLAAPSFPPFIEAPLSLLYQVDPAIERLQLMGHLAARHDLVALHPALGLLTGDCAVEDPWLVGFRVHARLPGRTRELRRWLEAHDGGTVELRLRGVQCDHAALVRTLNGRGATRYTIFLQRLGRREVAYITTSLPTSMARELT